MKTTLVNAGPSHTSIAVWASFAQAPDNRPLAWLSALLSPNSCQPRNPTVMSRIALTSAAAQPGNRFPRVNSVDDRDCW